MFSYDAPAGSAPFGRLAASPQRAALTLSLRDDTSDFAAAQVFSGPALGPWAPLTPMNRLSENFVLPWQHQVEGERVFTSEIRGSLENNVVVVRDPEPRDLALPYTAVFAGDLVAYTELAPGQDRTRSARGSSSPSGGPACRRGVTDLPEPIEHLALRPDGRVALTLADSGGIFEVRPGTAPRRVFRRATGYDEPLAFAGEHLVFAEYGRLRVLDPDGRVRAFGTPTEEMGRLHHRRPPRAVDGQRLPADRRRHRARRARARRRPVPAHRDRRQRAGPEPEPPPHPPRHALVRRRAGPLSRHAEGPSRARADRSSTARRATGSPPASAAASSSV